MRFRVRSVLLALVLLAAPTLVRADGGDWHRGEVWYNVPDCLNGAWFYYFIPQGGFSYQFVFDNGTGTGLYPITCPDAGGCTPTTEWIPDVMGVPPGVTRFNVIFSFQGDEPPPPEDLPFIYSGGCF
jgi:hypothetical protein